MSKLLISAQWHTKVSDFHYRAAHWLGAQSDIDDRTRMSVCYLVFDEHGDFHGMPPPTC